MAPSLADLPPEMLDIIVSQLDALSDLSHLSLVCKTLYTWAKTHGYRSFLRENFSSYRPPPYWKDAARSLTGLTSRWENRDFIARYIEPPKHATVSAAPHPQNGQTAPWTNRKHGPSIGYPAVVTCKEQWTGGDWRSRKETLVIGAGAELRLRTRSMGIAVDQSWEGASAEERQLYYDQLHHYQRWFIHRDSHHKEGKCDITTVNLVPNWMTVDAQRVVFGRACGALERITVTDGVQMGTRFAAKDGPIRFADLSPGQDPLLVAGQSYNIALYQYADTEEQITRPLAEVHLEREGRGGMLWTGRFMEQNSFVVGRDSKRQPLAMYSLRPDGFDSTPTWSVPASPNLSCVKIVCPVVDGSTHHPNYLLSGWKSGVVLLHDVRSPNHYVSNFVDPIDASSTFYSLLPFGMERFLAGSNKHGAIKVFDLRITGAKSYSTFKLPTRTGTASASIPAPLDATSPSARNERERIRPGNADLVPGSSSYDFTLFLRASKKAHYDRRRATWIPSRTLKNSSIYHLTAASPFAPTFYAGLEGTTVQVDMVSGRETNPDIAFEKHPLEKYDEPTATIQKKWLDPQNEQILLGLIEQKRPNNLFFQTGLGPWRF